MVKGTVEGQRVITYLCWGKIVLEVYLPIVLYYSTAYFPCTTRSAKFKLANHLSNCLNVPLLEVPANFCRGLPVIFQVQSIHHCSSFGVYCQMG